LLGGNYTNSAFNLLSDGKGGTLVVDPPLATEQGSVDGAANDRQLAQLVQALATFSVPSSAFDATPVPTAANDQSLRQTLGQAWHG
jgi:hypothetical protein